jgi:hypothetical protein
MRRKNLRFLDLRLTMGSHSLLCITDNICRWLKIKSRSVICDIYGTLTQSRNRQDQGSAEPYVKAERSAQYHSKISATYL